MKQKKIIKIYKIKILKGIKYFNKYKQQIFLIPKN